MISGRQQPACTAASVKRSLGKSIPARVSSPPAQPGEGCTCRPLRLPHELRRALFEMTHQDSDRRQDCSLSKKKVGHDFFYKSALSICDNLSAGSFWLRVDQLSAGMFGSPCFHYLCMDFPPTLCESPPRFLPSRCPECREDWENKQTNARLPERRVKVIYVDVNAREGLF